MNINQQPVDVKSILAKIKDNNLFKDSDTSDLNFDELLLNIIDLKAGETLYNQGDRANSIYLVVDGEINLITKQSYGKTRTVILKNNYLGQNEYLLKTKRNSTAIALKDSRIVELAKKDIELIIKQHSSILNNLRNSMLHQDPLNISSESIADKKSGAAENTDSVFPLELAAGKNETATSNSSEEKLNPEAVKSDNDVMELKKLETGINKVIKNLNENLSQLEKEKNKVQDVILDYEDKKKLLDDIQILKEKVSQLLKLDKEKNEILGQQSYRIIELEKERAKIKDLETDYKNKIELLSNEGDKDKNVLNKLESASKEKDKIISKLENEIEDIKKSISILNETRIKLLQENETYERVIKDQKISLKSSAQKIEKLSEQLSEKDKNIEEINKDLANKNLIISKQTDNVSVTIAEAEKLRDDLNKKNEMIENLTANLTELQNQLNTREENENINFNKEEELNEKISVLQSQLTEVNRELSKATNQTELASKIYDELKKERDNLLEEVKKLHQVVEENRNNNNNDQVKIKEELKKLNDDAEKYKNSSQEKDRIIEEQNNQLDNLKETKTAVIKTLNSAKGKFQEDIKKKEDQVADLMSKLENLKKTLEEKIFLEKLQSFTIENQAQKIAELEILNSEPKVNDVNEVSDKDENILPQNLLNVDLPATEQAKNDSSNEDEEILKDCRLIKSGSANRFMEDKSFDHFEYSDINIVNLNLSRATIETASSFNQFLNEIINDDENKIIVNLSKCHFVDSSILGVLVNSLKKARASKGDLRIVWPAQNEYSTFRLTSMDKIFQIFGNLKDAINSFSLK